MSQLQSPPMPLPAAPPECLPKIDHLVIQDDIPADSIYAEKQLRLLVASLYAAWPRLDPKRTMLALANVGLFYADQEPPVVPDVLVSLDVAAPRDLRQKKNRSYFGWVHGKHPDLTLEIVSGPEGKELTDKLALYERLGIAYYVVWDPEHHLSAADLHCFSLRDKKYQANGPWFPGISVGVCAWRGEFEGATDTWLRWCDDQGNVLLTSAEHAERLAAQLRSLGVEPEA